MGEFYGVFQGVIPHIVVVLVSQITIRGSSVDFWLFLQPLVSQYS